MRLYRVTYRDNRSTGHCGFSWHSSRAKAEKAGNEWWRANQPDKLTGDASEDLYAQRFPPSHRPEIETFEFEPTVDGLLHLLSNVASHPDNG